MDREQRKQETPMAKQDVVDRIHNFYEVALGYTEEQAQREATRCLQCPNPRCVQGCPVNIDIPAFIKEIKEGNYRASAAKLKEFNSLPAVCGRVCPQENQCQEQCVLGKMGDPISIGRLERFAADWERNAGVEIPEKQVEGATGKVAIVGSGPAGLTVAADLIKQGHEVVMFESLHYAGGVLMYGIPQFRLPKEIVQAEIDYIKKLGVDVKTNYTIGRIFTIDELFADGYDAIFIGSGAGLPNFMGIEGENLGGVYSANEYLIRINLMKGYLFPEYDTPIRIGKNVAVIGGGNVAMDAARCSLRLGAEKVYIVYRRAREQLPAREEEAENAEEEGIIFNLLTNPVKFTGDESGWVNGMECIKMELGEPDASGRRRPVAIEGSNFMMDVDTVVIAIGQTPNPLIQRTTDGLETTKWGTIVADDETAATSKEGVYAGGDVVSGAATVISAMGAGRKAAKSIHEYIQKKKTGQ
ncbi:MAG: NADPH-dependent glutamate synthase [Candidatus Bathyarchaeota archaeon]|nr:NADPH-dependent glutamate synthase [Candidatus Bathyarchaeum sp.]